MNKLTILIDQDNTIAQTHQSWVKKINLNYNRKHKVKDCTDWHLHLPLKLPESCYSILDEEYFFLRLKPISGARTAIKQLWREHNCYIVSAASYSNNAVREKWQWLQKYFPFIEKERVIFAKDKSVIRGDLLIDDAVHNVESFPMNSVIFNQPWNTLWKEHDRCVRLHNWNEIVKYIGGS